MTSLLDCGTVLVKERVGFFKAVNAYDLFEPSSGKSIGTVQEKQPSFFLKLMKFTKFKRYSPFSADVMDESGQKSFTLKRGFSFFRSTVQVVGPAEEKLGHFRQQLWSLGGKFEVYDSYGQKAAMVRGDWKGWNYNFIDNAGSNLATVSKKWAGAAKELFTSADVYFVTIEPLIKESNQRKLVLAAAICVDMVLHEAGR